MGDMATHTPRPTQPVESFTRYPGDTSQPGDKRWVYTGGKAVEATMSVVPVGRSSILKPQLPDGSYSMGRHYGTPEEASQRGAQEAARARRMRNDYDTKGWSVD